MNKLITNINGRFPFVLDDFRWAYEAVENAIINFTKAFGDAYILWGCEVTGSTSTSFTVAEGAMVLGGEVCYCPAHVITTPGGAVNEWYFAVYSEYDTAGNKIFGDNSIHDTYQKRTVKLQYFATTPSVSAVCINDLPRPTMAVQIVNLVKDLLKVENEDWHYVGEYGEPDTSFADLKDPLNNGRARFRKDGMGNVYVECYGNSGSYVGTLFTLPDGYKPERPYQTIVSVESPALIGVNGSITVLITTASFVLNVCFKAA